ncbi:tetratricopeptide repeat protein [bacterium]|nr:tetratricopeptide repeat protein [bacterium]
MTKLTIDQALQQGIEAHKAGQVQEADRLYTAILKAQPKHPDANHNMGALAVGVGKVEQALPFLRTALEGNPAKAQFWLSYIDALIKLGKLADAKAVFDQAKSKGAKGDGFEKLEQSLKEAGKKSLVASKTASKATPQQSNMLDALSLDQAIKLAKKQSKEGTVKEAKRIYQDILVKFPKNKRASDELKALARGPIGSTFKVQDPPQNQIQSLIKLYSRGQFKHGLQQATALLHKFPNSCFLYNIRGLILRATNQLDASIEAYTKALNIKPDYAAAYNNMGITLQSQGKLEEAIEAYNKALEIQPDFAEAYNSIATTLKNQDKLEEAIEAYSKALAIKPDFAEAHTNMGNALKDQGKLEEAIEAYHKALAIKPDSANAHRSLSTLIKYTLNDPQISVVDDLLRRENLHDSDRSQLYYTYAKMQEDLKDLSGAFDSYVAGGDLRRKLLAYEFNQDEHLFSQIKQTAPKFKDVAVNEASEPIRHTPIFILGMPRSGTTLVEQIVSSHSEVTGAGELEYVSRFGVKLAAGLTSPTLDAVSEFRERLLSELAKKTNGQAFITDKMPHNFLYIALICAALPEAKIVHVQRSAKATCWSNFKHHFSSLELGYSYNLSDTVRYYGLYKDLMHFWYQSYNNRIYNIDYEKLTEDQEPEIRRLIEYLELNWEDACLAPQNHKGSVKTASQQQVRQKIYTGSSEAWKMYGMFLDDVFRGLEA